MMSDRIELPSLDDLVHLGALVESSDEPGVVSVTTWARDGARVLLTWDAIAESVAVRWIEGDDARLALERETVTRVAVSRERDGLRFQISSSVPGLFGELVIHVGSRVTVKDTVLVT